MENINTIENNCLFYILSSVSLLSQLAMWTSCCKSCDFSCDFSIFGGNNSTDKSRDNYWGS